MQIIARDIVRHEEKCANKQRAKGTRLVPPLLLLLLLVNSIGLTLAMLLVVCIFCSSLRFFFPFLLLPAEALFGSSKATTVVDDEEGTEEPRCCSFGDCDCSRFVPSTSSRVRPSHPHLICATCGHGALYHQVSAQVMEVTVVVGFWRHSGGTGCSGCCVLVVVDGCSFSCSSLVPLFFLSSSSLVLPSTLHPPTTVPRRVQSIGVAFLQRRHSMGQRLPSQCRCGQPPQKKHHRHHQ